VSQLETSNQDNGNDFQHRQCESNRLLVCKITNVRFCPLALSFVFYLTWRIESLDSWQLTRNLAAMHQTGVPQIV
jgi:hypothetical protein